MEGSGAAGHFYCLVCKGNMRDGPGARKRHTAGEAHCRALDAFLESFTAEIRKRHREMREVSLRAEFSNVSTAEEAHEWPCPLCGICVATRRSPYRGHAVYQHLAGKKHSLAVDQFVSSYLSSSHRQRYKRKHLRITQGAFEKYKEREESYVATVPRVLLDRRAFPDTVPFPEISACQAQSSKAEHARGCPSPPSQGKLTADAIGKTGGDVTVVTPPSGPQRLTGAMPGRIEKQRQQLNDCFPNVREEIKALVAAANRISQRKKGLKETRHKRTNDDPIPSHRYLPNFGAVWSSGPRSQTRNQFKSRKLQ